MSNYCTKEFTLHVGVPITPLGGTWTEIPTWGTPIFSGDDSGATWGATTAPLPPDNNDYFAAKAEFITPPSPPHIYRDVTISGNISLLANDGGDPTYPGVSNGMVELFKDIGFGWVSQGLTYFGIVEPPDGTTGGGPFSINATYNPGDRIKIEITWECSSKFASANSTGTLLITVIETIV